MVGRVDALAIFLMDASEANRWEQYGLARDTILKRFELTGTPHTLI